MALLYMQLRIAQADTQDPLLPEERIAAVSLLLKQQAAEPENELFSLQEHLQEEMGLAFYQMPTAAMTAKSLGAHGGGLSGGAERCGLQALARSGADEGFQ